MNTFGQLGNGTRDSSATAVPVAGDHVFRQISVGGAHACALDDGGTIWCWGDGSRGQLGHGGTPDSTLPVATDAPGITFSAVSSGGFHSCGLTNGGSVMCWGDNTSGAVGTNGADDYHLSPALIFDSRSYTQVSAGAAHTCGVSAAAVYCWGRNNEGQIGTGATSLSPSLSPEPALGILGQTRAIDAGDTHSCAITFGGETYCWGDNTHGQLGDGTNALSPRGTLVIGGLIFFSITAGHSHSCGTRQNGATYCWGWNYRGRLGVGSFTAFDARVPVPVVP
jgi:alpha-tubulin suppressor-like RCC1 family protein